MVSTLTLLAVLTSFGLKAEGETSITVEVEGQGQPVLLIPGLMSDARVWYETAKQLGGDLQYHFVSVAGFAGKEAINDISIERVHLDLQNYIVNSKLDRVIVIGHSMGGLLAFKLAVSQPQKIAKAISVDGLPFIAAIFTRSNHTQAEDVVSYAKQMKTRYHLANNKSFEALITASLPIQAKTLQAQARVFNMAKASEPLTVGNFIYDLMTTDVRESLKKTSVPLLLLGASGAFKADSEHKAIESLYQGQFDMNNNVKVVMNRGSRHFIMFDDLSWLVAQLKLFI